MGLLDSEMLSLCIFDIYRGCFVPQDMRVSSSAISSELQASAKLSLLAYLLHRVNSLEPTDISPSLKGFVGDLVIGIHAEIVPDESNDFKKDPEGLEKHLGSAEYQKLNHAVTFLANIWERENSDWQKMHNEKDLRCFKSSQLEQVGNKLTEL